jgi:hypothetical protein
MTSTNVASGTTSSTGTRQSTNGPRIATVVVAALAAAAVWFVARVAYDVEIVAKTGASETKVQLPSVIIATVVSGLLGWGLLELLERKASSPRTVWTIVATVAFVLSLLGGPLGGVTTGAQVSLACLHAVAALVLIPGLARTVRKL